MLDAIGRLLGFKPGQLKISSRLLLLLLLGLALIVAGGLFGRPKAPSQPSVADAPPTVSLPSSGGDPSGYAEYEKALSAEMERVLSQIEGAGRVTVSVTLESGPEYRYAQDENTTERKTEETDKSGGSRVITEIIRNIQLVLTRPTTGQEKPVVTAIDRPAVRGVVVVAPGAVDSRVRARLTEAVQTYLGIPAYRVQVIPKSSGG